MVRQSSITRQHHRRPMRLTAWPDNMKALDEADVGRQGKARNPEAGARANHNTKAGTGLPKGAAGAAP